MRHLRFETIIGCALAIGAFLGLFLGIVSCASNHCRMDQRVPEGETFESAERLSKEQCK